MAASSGGSTLAAALEAAGFSATASEATLAQLLAAFPNPSEQAVGEALAAVVRTSEGTVSGDTSGPPGSLATQAVGDGSKSWNVGVLVEGLKAANPRLDWRQVAEALDVPGFTVPDAGALKVLAAAWARATTEPFPLQTLAARIWANIPGQLSFLRLATAAPPELFSWAHAVRKQELVEGLHAGKSPYGTPNQAWLCLDLYDTLAALADGGHAPAVRHILEVPLKACPEVLVLGMAAVKGSWGPLQQVGCARCWQPRLVAVPSRTRALRTRACLDCPARCSCRRRCSTRLW